MSNILKHTTLGEIIFSKTNLITVDAKDNIEKVLQVMSDNGISSVPVFHSGKAQFIGMVEIWDLMSVFAFASFHTPKTQSPEQEEKFEPLKFSAFTMQDVLDDITRTRSLYVYEPSSSLEVGLKPMVI